jgi:hypothetical protein
VVQPRLTQRRRARRRDDDGWRTCGERNDDGRDWCGSSDDDGSDGDRWRNCNDDWCFGSR